MKRSKKVLLVILLMMILSMTGCGAGVEKRKEENQPSGLQEENGQTDSGNVLSKSEDSENSQGENEISSFVFEMSTFYSIGDEEFNGGRVASGTMKTGDSAVLVKSGGVSYETKIERMALYNAEDKGNPTPVSEAEGGPLVFIWLEKNEPVALQYGDILLGAAQWEQGIEMEFPFEEPEEYTLVFAPQEKEKTQGEFRLYDGDGALVQQIPYGVYELPYYYALCRKDKQNLVFFSNEENRTGCIWEWDGERFSQSDTDIKRNMTNYPGDLLITEETETKLIREIYRPHYNDRQAEMIRCYELQKEKGELEIWDCLDQKSLFQEVVAMKEDKTPVNEEYYQVMFTEGLYPWAWEDEEEETSVFVDISSLSSADEFNAEYKNEKSFLDDYGFADSRPFYEFYDRLDNLRLALYKKESEDLFCGILYRYFYNSDKQKCAEMSGFVTDDIMEAEWEDDTYSVMSLLDPYDYEKSTEYTEDRKPTYYIVKGDDGTVEKEEENVMLMEIDYIYRDDGTLYDRHYRHNPYLLSTTRQSEDSLYDKKERLVYQQAYITHGTLEDYYIYLDESDKPAYHLNFDYAGGPAPFVSMERYR